ncbi:MAG: hypothetical protein CBE47_00165 [Pelagibacteraceae bacterium TMED287]|nr:MAG: hypothetical protein CBE47_00165 [Pelagibacteraceae bacterium TMED287]|tara:strand:+ start:5340 stop:5972 length:633 start_codon:yes stop_codon:yes gene_type:complete
MKDNFPKYIPVFPLGGVIYFPKTNLPLNIFEERYLQLVEDIMKSNKLMGMVQSKKLGDEIYSVGCLGKISNFKKGNDGRVLINLTGLTRFEVVKELKNSKLYREFEVNYKKFYKDVRGDEEKIEEKIDLSKSYEKIKNFFVKNGLIINWKELTSLKHEEQFNTIAMIAPISNEEKQTILESVTLYEKVKTINEIIEFYFHEKNENNITIQ